LNADDGEGGAGNDGAASNSQAAGPRAERATNKPRSWLPALSRCWVAASSVRDIVCGLDWERIRVHYDVIVRAQAVGILGTSRRAVLDSHLYSSSPPNLDVSALVVAIASYGSQQSAGGGVGQASDLIVGLSGLAVGSDLSQLQRDGIVDVNEYCRRCCPELGCKWVQVTGTLQPAGSPLSNEALKRALQETRVSTM
jgi:hypothetical protein